MFNHPTTKHASGFVDYGFQPWRFDAASSDASAQPGPSFDEPMDWTSSDPSSYQDVELDSLNPVQPGGVGRLVAHFENMGSFDDKSFEAKPPLPPRPGAPRLDPAYYGQAGLQPDPDRGPRRVPVGL